MRTAIDRSGRIVVPKPIRDRLRLLGGEELEITERDGIIEMWIAPLEVDVVDAPEGPVAVPRRSVPPLTNEIVRDTLERVRR